MGLAILIEPHVAEQRYAAAVTVASAAFGVKRSDILLTNGRRNRGHGWHRPDVVAARRSALYLAVVSLESTARSIARVAGLSAQGVVSAVRAIEDAREDQDFDAAIGQLEQELAA